MTAKKHKQATRDQVEQYLNTQAQLHPTDPVALAKARRELVDGPPAEDAPVTITITRAELALLREALDSHRYWQLADENYRNDGYVLEPGSDDDENVEALRAADALEQKLALL